LVDLFKRYRRTHPGLARKEIEDLVSSIRNEKYWNALPSSRDAVYVLALSRARVRVKGGKVATVTHFGKVLVEEGVAKFCSRGKVLLLIRDDSHYTARYVITWPAFLNVMRGDAGRFYDALVRSGITELVGVKKAREMMTGTGGTGS
jgi:hypothetical protein